MDCTLPRMLSKYASGCACAVLPVFSHLPYRPGIYVCQGLHLSQPKLSCTSATLMAHCTHNGPHTVNAYMHVSMYVTGPHIACICTRYSICLCMQSASLNVQCTGPVSGRTYDLSLDIYIYNGIYTITCIEQALVSFLHVYVN